MRHAIRNAPLALAFAAAALHAQPVRPSSAGLPLLQAVSLDVSAAVQDRLRIALEPIIVGRMSLALGASFSTHSREGPVALPAFDRTEPAMILAPCLPESCTPTPPAQDRFRSSSLGVRLRWYPKLLSGEGERGSVAFYVGESLDWQERSATTYTYYPYPMGADILLVAGGIDWPYGETYERHTRGFEPSFEFGARLMMSRRLLVEVGTVSRVVLLDDPNSRDRRGGIDTRIALSLGFGW